MSPTLYGPDNVWQFDSDDHFPQTQTRNGALGTESRVEPSNVNYDSVRFFNTYSPSVRAEPVRRPRHLLRRAVEHRARLEDAAAFEASPFVTYSREHGFDLSRQVAAGPGATLVFDNRDVPADPSHGWSRVVDISRVREGFSGRRFQLAARSRSTCAPTGLDRTNRHTLALWGYGDFVTAGTAPYLSLPMTGGDPRGRSGRGYAEGQFRGDRFVYGEAEYRATLTANGLLGMTLFANVSTAASSAGERTALRFGGAGRRRRPAPAAAETVADQPLLRPGIRPQWIGRILRRAGGSVLSPARLRNPFSRSHRGVTSVVVTRRELQQPVGAEVVVACALERERVRAGGGELRIVGAVDVVRARVPDRFLLRIDLDAPLRRDHGAG